MYPDWIRIMTSRASSACVASTRVSGDVFLTAGNVALSAEQVYEDEPEMMSPDGYIKPSIQLKKWSDTEIDSSFDSPLEDGAEDDSSSEDGGLDPSPRVAEEMVYDSRSKNMKPASRTAEDRGSVGGRVCVLVCRLCTKC